MMLLISIKSIDAILSIAKEKTNEILVKYRKNVKIVSYKKIPKDFNWDWPTLSNKEILKSSVKHTNRDLEH